ncbi:Testis-expressed sequence 13B protein [Sciurus carolinensis]|uniref:Testis-expressed sequence 13B protein n=1 Tax=Sciurus carolinensis TaxID=30640 RepID=A0AA41MCR0_SCICA|nr:testis-expressed protein 13D [Sciurus carolinensis]MBZ3869527.1 Testis-expressed sequence 13B protein [Sciurus carolinensis]
MAVEFGDHASGFRHNEVIRFINNEVLMNGGGPEFYMAFRSRPWNEVEDRLRTVVMDPQVPRALKRACTWSALALGVRVVARQREQQGRRVRRLQDQVEEREAACWALASELQQLREERDEVVTQLLFTRAALQQATNECDMLRGRLFQVEGLTQVTPLVHAIVPGLRADQFGPAVWPLNAEQQREVGAIGRNDRVCFEAPTPAPTTVLYVPGHPSPWAPPMQPPLQIPLPYPIPFQPPLPVGFPYLPPPTPAVVMEAEAGVVPLHMPPVGIYPPGPWVAGGFQNEMAPLSDQRYYVQAEGPVNLQESVLGDNRSLSQAGLERPQVTPPLVNMGNYSQEGGPLRHQGTLSMVNSGKHNAEEGPQRSQGMPASGDSVCHSQQEGPEQFQGMNPLVNRGSHIQEEGSEIPQGLVSLGDRGTHSQEGPQSPQGMVPLVDIGNHSQEKSPQMSQVTYLVEENGHHSQEEDQQMSEGIYSLEHSRSHCQEEGSERFQGMAPLGFSVSHNQEEQYPERVQRITLPRLNRRYSLEEGAERPRKTTVWESWSQAMRESPRKQHKAKQPQGRRALGSYHQEKYASRYSQENWICLWCKAMNFSWRTICYKCKEACVPVEGGGVNTGQIH